jgi:putative addiction module component (TIGR02574 family)
MREMIASHARLITNTMSTYEEIENAALALPPEAREMLAEHLMASLSSIDPVEQAEIDAYWIQVADRRAKEIEDGIVTPIPGEEVMARLRSRYKRKK